MELLPFNIYAIKGNRIACPMCNTAHDLNYKETMPKVRYCEMQHNRDPRFDVTTQDMATQPHLHVTCLRCGFEWLEQTYLDSQKGEKK